jgi:hypothetical protein
MQPAELKSIRFPDEKGVENLVAVYWSDVFSALSHRIFGAKIKYGAKKNRSKLCELH